MRLGLRLFFDDSWCDLGRAVETARRLRGDLVVAALDGNMTLTYPDPDVS